MDWLPLISFPDLPQAHILQGSLIEEGFDVQILDQMTIEKYSVAFEMGVVTIYIPQDQFEKAKTLLHDLGYKTTQEEVTKFEEKLIQFIDRIKKNWTTSKNKKE